MHHLRPAPALALALALTLTLPTGAGAAWNDWMQRLGSALESGGATPSAAALTDSDLARGLKEALGVGVERATQLLGRDGGFLDDAEVRIPMPPALRSVERALRAAGQSRLADEFVATINHAAEQAVPATKAVFVDAIRQMSLDDARAILAGPDDAATRYFREHAGKRLTAAIRPIVEQATAKAGVTASYKRLVDGLGPLARLAAPGSLDLDGYVTDKAVDGVFVKLAEEERRIRRDPLARSTELLRKVFSTTGS